MSWQELYLPVESTSIHYLKTRMCVGSSKGFDIVDLETLETLGLLDPADESLEFVRTRENLRPMAIYRINNDFLLCYDGVSPLRYSMACLLTFRKNSHFT
jgi:hypothetical protein